ncbi:hypothetical protein [Arthrobacter sp. ISL-72]|uniref:hypothetical protein n=1 Tax=Arthrobacter sp. ISL-72 TaxID=2819114 RepID=UPI002034CB6D|nr:hypothetical protein [Arthrobacter sp. ISL-72]
MSGAASPSGASFPGIGTWIGADPLRAVLAAVAVITIFSGAVQIPFGGPVLELLGAEPTTAARQLFATVGMFMVVVGGLLLHTLLRPTPAPEVLLWSGVQKAGACAAVAVGVMNGVFAPVALAVAVFDLATAALCLIYLRRVYWEHGGPGGRRGP